MGGETNGRQSHGQRAEEAAVAYLVKSGYKVVARNWRVRGGELDIIAREGDSLVFVEVRSRMVRAPSLPPALGAPEDSVTRSKQRRLAAMAGEYVYRTGWEGPWRIDVLALELCPDGSVARAAHYRDAVGGG